MGLLGAFLGGTVFGWRLFDERALAGAFGSEEPEVIEIRVPSRDGANAGATMPDVRGLDESVAVEVLADTVLDGDTPVVQHRPWAGAEGIVIEQRPPFGIVNPAAVTLVVSQQATVPDVIDRPLAEVVDELADLGTRVEVERRMAEGVDSDTVLAVEPSTGEPLPDVVQLVTSEPSASVFLGNLDTVSGRCSTGEASMDGETYAQALTCSAGEDAVEVEWLLGRAVERIEGVVGLPDDGPTDLDVRVELLADGERVAETTVGYGEAVAFEGRTAGALRLMLRASIVTEDPGRRTTDVVLGDVRLIGSSDGLRRLQDES